MSQTNQFNFHGVLITLKDPENDFLKIAESLTRMGLQSSSDDNILYQACHILHKQGQYRIMHYDEMFELDLNSDNEHSTTFQLDSEGKSIRNKIVKLLSDWNLIGPGDYSENPKFIGIKSSLKIIKHSEKNKYILKPVFIVGRNT